MMCVYDQIRKPQNLLSITDKPAAPTVTGYVLTGFR